MHPFQTLSLGLALAVSSGSALSAPDASGASDAKAASGSPAKASAWREPVRQCLDTLIEHGRDQYGPRHTAMFMSILDVHTLTAPAEPAMLDDQIRTEDRPDHGRRSPGGCNLWLDQPLLGVLYRMTELTGDSKYARAADAYIHDTFEYAVKPNGMLGWGSHIYYQAFNDRLSGDGDGKGPHEILIKIPDWEHFYRINPQATRREIEGIWKWHIVDKKTGLHNRHDDGHVGCDFAFSGGSFAIAFASMYRLTGEPDWLDKAKLVAAWHWENRNKTTNLTADCPNLKQRYDGNHCFTTLPGPHAAMLLRCYELTHEPYFREAAIGHILAYDQYGWDESAGTFHGMLTLDGKPIPEQKKGAGYDIWKPTGHIDIWRTTMYSYEMPLIAAEATIYAHRLADKPEVKARLLTAARHWAEAIRNELPPKPGRRWKTELETALPKVKETGGTYAENYGRAISFFIGLYQITGDAEDLKTAQSLAKEAVDKLFVNGIFRGHPAKDFYQANDGVGLLLHALLQLDALPAQWRLAF